MAELSLRDRLQPSLLDRLTDQAPTRLTVLLGYSRAALRSSGVSETALLALLREHRLKVLEESKGARPESDGDDPSADADDRRSLVLEAPRPFMSAGEFEGLAVGADGPRLDQIAEIGYRRVRINTESRDERFLSMRRLRESVLRDLNWLLNTGNLENLNDPVQISHHPEVCNSVVNYGIPDITGMFVRGAPPELLERVIGDAIRRFEPRILPHTLQVSSEVDTEQMSRRTLRFHIEGQLWGQPLPEQLYLQTEVDLGSGDVQVAEAEGGGEA